MTSSEIKHAGWVASEAGTEAAHEKRSWKRILRQMIIPVKGQKTLPTFSGYILILLCLGVGVAAYNTASNILFITVSFLLSSLILNGVLSWLNFNRLRWAVFPQTPFRVGTPAQVRLEVENSKRFITTFSLWFDMVAKSSSLKGRVPLGRQLKPESTVSLDWEFIPAVRGRECIEVKSIGSQFPFGYLTKMNPGHIKAEVVVWPERVDYAFKDFGGQKLAEAGRALKRKGDGEDLLGIRRYEKGDPCKHIHWKASARRGSLMVRELAEDRQDGYILAIDTSAVEWKDEAKLEMLCRFALSLAEDLFTRNQLNGTVINTGNVNWIRSISDLERFFDELSVVEPDKTGVQSGFASRRNTITFEPVNPGYIHAMVGRQQVGQA